MTSYLRPSLVLLGLFSVLTGAAYPLAVTGVAQAVFPAKANGSPVMKDGAVIGSALIGQSFTSDRYFHGRPSATSAPDQQDASKTVDSPYNAANSTGSNLGPGSATLKAAITDRVAVLGGGPQPADLVTASGSGLDPDLSPQAALAQVVRVAKARGVAEDSLRRLVQDQVEPPLLGILGEPRVNVLALNLALDRLAR
jgi:K+-transporting ATPase ATPase C chain